MKSLINETPVRINTTIQDRRGTLIKLPAGTEVISIKVSPNMENVWLVWKTDTGTERGKIDMIVPYAMTYDWSNIIHDDSLQPTAQ
jgi:hypothetical protein